MKKNELHELISSAKVMVVWGRPMKGDSLVPLVVGAAAITLAAYFFSPFIAVANLSAAASSGDRERLEQLVDFPAVRSNLKAEIVAEHPVASLAVLAAPSTADRLVDAYVTPDAIGTMVATARAPNPLEQISSRAASGKAMLVGSSYAGLDLFRAYLAAPSDPSRKIGLVLERRGFLHWRLIRILLLQDSTQAPSITPPPSFSEQGSVTSAQTPELQPLFPKPSDEPN